MPYSGADDPNLPSNVKKMPAKARRQWVDIFNSALSSCLKDGGKQKECETSAFKQANGVLKKEDSSMLSIFEVLKNFITRSIKKVDTWDGAASNYADTDAYCKACLIDVNSAAGRSTKAQDHCMLPIREPGDATSVYVDKAVHAAAGGHGITQVKKPDDVAQADWDKAIKAAANKIISAYDSMSEVAPDAVYKLADKTPPKTRAKNLFEYFYLPIDTAVRTKDNMAWLNDIYADEDSGELFAIITSNSKLYKAPITFGNNEVTMGDWIEVKLDFPPVTQMRTKIIRQADGKVRWLSISCSSVLNRMGEVDSKALFKSFVDQIEKTGKYPVRQFMHCGEDFITGQADFVGVDDNLLITSGLYNDTELAKREIAARELDPEYWGESIGFLPEAPPKKLMVSDGVSIPVYEEGTFEEISTCPEKFSCAWFTSTTVFKEVNLMLEKRQMDALVKIFGGDEEATKAWLEANVDEVNRQIKNKGLITLVADAVVTPVTEPVVPPVTEPVTSPDPEPLAVPVVPPTEPVVEPPSVEVDEPTIHAIGDYVLSGLGTKMDEAMKPLNELISGLQTRLVEVEKQVGEFSKISERLAALETDEEERKRVWLEDAPPRPAVRITHRPRIEEPVPASVPVVTMADIAAETLEKMGIK